MATHSAFLRKTGVDGRTIGVDSQRRIRVLDGALNPNAAFGNVYWVDKASGSNSSDGLSPEGAFLTVANAITISNAEVGSYDMNTIYVNSNTYTEDLTEEPKNVNIVGIGAKTRIQGTHVFDTGGNSAQNCHWWNMQFRDTTGVNFTITSNYYGLGWHGCTFENSGTATGALKLSLVMDLMIEDCRFLGNPVFTTAIQISGHQYRSEIRRNWIAATTNGILVDAGAQGYGNLMSYNTIGRVSNDPNSSVQMTYGIRLAKTDGTSAWTLVRNFIEAADAIKWDTADTNSHNLSIANSVVEAGTGVMQDPLT